MLLLNEYNKTVIISSLYDPIVFKSYWVLDLVLFDYKLANLNMLEESLSPAFLIRVGVAVFTIPANWYVLVYDEETTQLDTVSINDITNKDYTVLVSNMHNMKVDGATIHILDYIPDAKCVYPTLSKSHMMCHPIYDNTWINIAPNDTYNRYLKSRHVSDI